MLGPMPFSILSHASKGDERMDMDVLLHVRTKGVENGNHPWQTSYILRLCSEIFHGCPGCSHCDVVEGSLVESDQLVECMRDREDDMDIGYVKEFLRYLFLPQFSFPVLTKWTL